MPIMSPNKLHQTNEGNYRQATAASSYTDTMTFDPTLFTMLSSVQCLVHCLSHQSFAIVQVVH